MGMIMRTLLGIIILVMITFGIIWLYFNFTGLVPTPAHLIADGGVVELKSGANWASVDNLDLSPGDVIRTASNGEATIFFFESSFIKLFPNTEIEIKELDKSHSKVVLKQNYGSSWSHAVSKRKNYDPLTRIIDYLGLNFYQIEVSGAIMTAKGDSIVSFGVDLDENRLAVEDGPVNLDIKIVDKDIFAGEEAAFGTEISLRKLNSDAFVKAGDKSQQENLLMARERIKKKYAGLLAIVKNKSGLSDTELDFKIDDYLRGK